MLKRTVLFVGVALVATSAATPAVASGPYGPVPTGPSGVPGGYTEVVKAVTVGRSGGTIHAHVAGARDAIVVRPGTFSHRVEIEITEPNLRKLNRGLKKAGLADFRAVTGLGVKALNMDGSAVAGSFSKPIIVRITKDGVHEGERVVKFTSATRTKRLRRTIDGHTVSIPLHRDPDIAVLRHR